MITFTRCQCHACAYERVPAPRWTKMFRARCLCRCMACKKLVMVPKKRLPLLQNSWATSSRLPRYTQG